MFDFFQLLAVSGAALIGTLAALKVEMRNLKERLKDIEYSVLRAHKRIDNMKG